jgi:hypothetical protein
MYNPRFPSWKIQVINELKKTTTLTWIILHASPEVTRDTKSPKWKSMFQTYFKLEPKPTALSTPTTFLQQTIFLNPKYITQDSPTPTTCWFL